MCLQIQQALRNHFGFRYNWFIKSRTVNELQRRVDFLVRLLEKEQIELNNKKKRKTNSKKSAPAKKKRKR